MHYIECAQMKGLGALIMILSEECLCMLSFNFLGKKVFSHNYAQFFYPYAPAVFHGWLLVYASLLHLSILSIDKTFAQNLK